MPYAIARIYSGSHDSSPQQLSDVTIKEFASKLARSEGFLRYSTIEFSDGRLGSFSVYKDQQSTLDVTEFAAAWARSDTMRGMKLAEAMEGETGFTIQGQADGDGRLYAVARIYNSGATLEDLSAALEKEARSELQNLPGLARYTAAKLLDGRLACFSAFDNMESAEKSTAIAKALRDKPDSQLARILPSDPQVIEGTILQTFRK